MRSAICVGLMLFGASNLMAQTTYSTVVTGTRCGQSLPGYQTASQMECTYTVGKGLRFTIAGVGQDDAAITVERAEGLESDYYMTVGVLHGCITVKRGFEKPASEKNLPGFDMAFVSPRNGRVYKTWQECGAAGK